MISFLYKKRYIRVLCNDGENKVKIDILNKGIILCILISLGACSSISKEEQKKVNMQTFGAKFEGRNIQEQPLSKVSFIKNQENIVNSKQFLTQLNYLRNSSPKLAEKFEKTYQKVLLWVHQGARVETLPFFDVDIQRMKGQEGYQNVLMTGYYSPVLHARKNKVGEFIYPIYALPKYKGYSRAQIYNGALKGKGLELAYSNSLMDNFLLGVQGSGYVDLGNGQLDYLAYAGQNGKKYVSIGRLLIEDGEIPKEKMSIQAIRDWAKAHPDKLKGLLERNPSYIYFKEDPKGSVKGAAGVPLVPMASVAADRNILPSGSIILVEVPTIDDEGHWEGTHKLHLMIALDVGGAVKGQHFDLYRGIGDSAGHIAGLSKHFGRAWVLQ